MKEFSEERKNRGKIRKEAGRIEQREDQKGGRQNSGMGNPYSRLSHCRSDRIRHAHPLGDLVSGRQRH